jgi:thiosulfate dehydrogenase [quinone] large subunit
MTEADQLKTIREYSVTGLLLRLPLGLLFFFAGLNKFLGGYGNFVRWIVSDMGEKTWLPDAMLYPYGYALPFLELGLGALLILGLFTRPALIATGFLLLSLMFGKILAQDHATVANIANYCLIAAVGYYFNRHHLFSLDALLRKAHFSEEI